MTEDEMRCYSAALDEIFRLRQALAYEALVTDAHLGYKTFPKSRRKVAEEQSGRMTRCARGESQGAYAGTSYLSLRAALREAGARECLTRGQFEAELPQRPSDAARHRRNTDAPGECNYCGVWPCPEVHDLASLWLGGSDD